MGTRQRKRLLQRRKHAESMTRTRGRRRAVLSSVVLAGVAAPVLAPSPASADDSWSDLELVADLTPGAASTDFWQLEAWGDSLLFRAGPDGAKQLWTAESDAPPVRVFSDPPIDENSIGWLQTSGDKFFFTAVADDAPAGTDETLWVSDGTDVGTTQLTDVQPLGSDDTVTSLAVVDGTLFFSHNDVVDGAGLWSSDGTEAGTRLVAELGNEDNPPNADPTLPGGFVAFGDRVVFAASAYDEGAELWATDGTEAGTRVLLDESYHFAASPTDLTPAGDTLFFTRGSVSSLRGLWKTDGTRKGTKQVIKFKRDSGDLEHLERVGSRVFFETANDGKLWTSNGTAKSTRQLPGAPPGRTTHAVSSGGQIFFTRVLKGGAQQLWRTDGTRTGTWKLASLGGLTDSMMSVGKVVDGRFWFAASTPARGTELWASDGSRTGTARVADIASGNTSSSPWNFTGADGVWFTADDGTHGRELWRAGLDTEVAAPRVKAAAKQRQSAGDVRVTARVRAGEAVTARASAVVSVKGRSQTWKLKPASVWASADGAVKVNLKAKKSVGSAIWKAVQKWRAAAPKDRKNRVVRAAVTVKFTDPAGNLATRVVTVKLI